MPVCVGAHVSVCGARVARGCEARRVTRLGRAWPRHGLWVGPGGGGGVSLINGLPPTPPQSAPNPLQSLNTMQTVHSSAYWSSISAHFRFLSVLLTRRTAEWRHVS